VPSKKMWEALDVVVEQGELAEVLEVEDEGHGYLLDLVLAEVECLDSLVSLSAQLLDSSDFIHMKMELLEVWHETADVRDLRELVAIEIKVCH